MPRKKVQHVLQFWITPEGSADLKARAAAAGCSVSKYVRRALWPPYGFAPGEIAETEGGTDGD